MVLLGLGTTVASAWICAALPAASRAPRLVQLAARGDDPEAWLVFVDERPGATRVRRLFRGVDASVFEQRAPWWFPERWTRRRHDVADELIVASGWPFPCLAVAFPARGGPVYFAIDDPAWGIALPPDPAPISSDHEPRGLPLWPIALPLAVDVLLHASAIGTIVLLAGATPRWLRSRRGRCPACGYDRRGDDASVCPECGQEPPAGR